VKSVVLEKRLKGRIIGKPISLSHPENPPPPLWRQFDAIARLPLLVIRGGNSDILSAATVAAMQARHPGLEAIEVPGEGHAPLICAPTLISRIVAFCQSCERGGGASRPAEAPARPGHTSRTPGRGFGVETWVLNLGFKPIRA
jgi:hypothetical protein